MSETYFDLTSFSNSERPTSGDEYNLVDRTWHMAGLAVLGICSGCPQLAVTCNPAVKGVEKNNCAAKLQITQKDLSAPPDDCLIRGKTVGFYFDSGGPKAEIIA